MTRSANQLITDASVLSNPECGAAMVEFAVSAVILFTLLFGSIVVCMAFYTYEVVNQYARDASRYAIVHGNGCSYTAGTTTSSCSIATGCSANAGATAYLCTGANSALKTYLNHEIYPGINGNSLTISTSYSKAPGASVCTITNCNGAGDQVTVTVTYPYLYAVPFVSSRSVSMNGSSAMIISQ